MRSLKMVGVSNKRVFMFVGREKVFVYCVLLGPCRNASLSDRLLPWLATCPK
jgi:hypothetical protein